MKTSKRWFKTLTNGEDSLFNRINVNSDSIIICLERESNNSLYTDPIKNFAVFNSLFELTKFCADTPFLKRSFYEIIRGNCSQKHYVDIDIELKDDNFVEKYHHSIEEKINISNVIVQEYISAIIKLKPEISPNDILVFNSNSDNKRSYHIVIDRWYFPSATQNKEFFNECMELIPLQHHKYFDDRMYKSIQQFRLYLSTKCGKNRFKKLDSQSTWKYLDEISNQNMLIREIFNASLITSVSNDCRLMNFICREKNENVASRNLENRELNLIYDLFSRFKDANSFEIQPLKGSVIPLKRKCSTFCNICQRVHDNENAFIYLSFDNNLYFNCRRNDSSEILGNIYSTNINLQEKEISSNYEIPKLSYNVQITNLTDNGVLNLSPQKSEISNSNLFQNSIQKSELFNSNLIQSSDENESSPILPLNNDQNQEKNEFDLKLENAKKRHQNNNKIKISKRLENLHNKLTII